MESEIQIRDLMSEAFPKASPDEFIGEISREMAKGNHSCVVIVEDDVPVGIITESDIVRFFSSCLGAGCPKDERVDKIMSSHPTVIREERTLFDALVISRSNAVRHLPVVDDDGKIKGLVTQGDLAQAYFQVVEKQKHLVEENSTLAKLSMQDSMLHIGNRRAMEVDIAYTHSLALRYKRPYALLMFDVDFFKPYNDHYGHLAGDKVLRRITEMLRSQLRESDRLYRYGGEEIVLLAADTALEGAVALADKIVASVAAMNIRHAASECPFITVSCGIAATDYDTLMQKHWIDLLRRADECLLNAKREGRNQTCHRLPNEPEPGSADHRSDRETDS